MPAHHPAPAASAEPGAAQTTRQRPLFFQTPDGFPLAGTLFEGDGDGPMVLISSATAVPQGFYASFAAH